MVVLDRVDKIDRIEKSVKRQGRASCTIVVRSDPNLTLTDAIV